MTGRDTDISVATPPVPGNEAMAIATSLSLDIFECGEAARCTKISSKLQRDSGRQKRIDCPNPLVSNIKGNSIIIIVMLSVPSLVSVLFPLFLIPCNFYWCWAH